MFGPEHRTKCGGSLKRVRPEVEERFGLFLEAPLTREAAYQTMWGRSGIALAGTGLLFFQMKRFIFEAQP
jgi:hypothetical protein